MGRLILSQSWERFQRQDDGWDETWIVSRKSTDKKKGKCASGRDEKYVCIRSTLFIESIFANTPTYSLKCVNPEVKTFSVIYGHTQSDNKFELPEAHLLSWGQTRPILTILLSCFGFHTVKEVSFSRAI